jgi:phospholipid/cholesterol/gamma-HCH transport system permease protein
LGFQMAARTKASELPGRMRVEQTREGELRLVLQGRLDADSVGSLWPEAMQVLAKHKPSLLIIDAGEVGVDYCDGAGVGFLLNLGNHQKRANAAFEIQNLPSRFEQLLAIHDPGQLPFQQPKRRTFRSLAEDVGKAVAGMASDIKTLIVFTGELTVSLLAVLLHPRRLRWKDAILMVELAGANAFGIIAVMSLLFGLILAFQSAIPMARFGAQIFVADLVAISTIRELGPLITAIILAGRTGSAFAAELGTMKVKEEVDALTTMGLEPVRFLIAPRVVAAVFVTPLLVIFSNLFALLGCAVVMKSLGFTMITYVNRVQAAIGLTDIFGGLLKSVFFGVLVAAIGCLRGMQTATGAQAVGISATRAVVSGIFLILCADAVFAVLFYYLGI